MRTFIRCFWFLAVSFTFIYSQSLLDGFNRTNSTTVGNNWSETESAASGAGINTNRLQMITNSVNGREWVYQDISSQYQTTLTNASQVLTWACNMRQSNPNPDGFNAGKYGILFVLAASTSDFATANGYGVSIGKDGGTFPVSLIRFTGGFDSETKMTDVIIGGDFKTQYASIKVTFDPSTDTWTLFAEGNPTTFTDPLNISTQIGSPTVDATHTSQNLAFIGAYYNHGSSASETAIFDNFYIPGAASPSTQVQFASGSAFVNEGAGSYSIQVSISNPDGTNSTTADVVLTGGTATNGTDIGTYSTQQVTFPAGSSTNQTVLISITEDPDIEGPENLQFELQNVSGGNNAQAGVPGSLTLNISDNDIALLMISEVADPSDNTNYRFVELYNNGSAIDFSTQTWYLSRQNNGSTNQWTDIQLTGTAASHSIFTVAYSAANFLAAFGVNPDQSNTGIAGDGQDGYFLYYGGTHSTGTLVDAYGSINQSGTGQLWEYTSGHATRNSGVGGPNPTWTYSEWTIERPASSAQMNPSDSYLPIELTNFSSSSGNNFVLLKWSTASEINNLGFNIKRSIYKNGPYEEIDSYKYNQNLKGAGTSSQRNDYSYLDEQVLNGSTYWYKLEDIDINGLRAEHGPVFATPQAALIHKPDKILPEKFNLYTNAPNPFNPTTKISFDVPEMSDGPVNLELTIYNITGQKIITLFDGVIESGAYTTEWNGRNAEGDILPSGIYVYQLKTNYFLQAKRMVLLK